MVDDPNEYQALSDEKKAALQAWIARTYRSARTELRGLTSYGLKHEFERSSEGVYVTNGEFKGAMQAAGFQPIDPAEQNWRFRIRLQQRSATD